MAFHDVRLPEDVERGVSGGPVFKTTIFELSSGQESRNIDWQQSRGRWDAGYGISTIDDFTKVIEFFYARQGRAHSFRFKDWADYKITNQTIAVTDGTTNSWALFKSYTSGSITFKRLLSKAVNTTMSATVNGVAIVVTYNNVNPSVNECSIDLTTGLIRLGATHAATTGQNFNISLEFDNVCRFDTDSLNVDLETFAAGSVPNLPIIEVRDT